MYLRQLCLQRATKLILWVLCSRYFRYTAGLLQINVSSRLFTLSHLQLSEISSTHFVDIRIFLNFCYWKRNLYPLLKQPITIAKYVRRSNFSIFCFPQRLQYNEIFQLFINKHCHLKANNRN